MQILFCDSPGVLRIIYLIKMVLNIVRFVLPIGLILMVTIDIYKNMLNGYGENKDVTIKKTMDRVLACIIVFCVPTIINLIFSILSKVDINTGNYIDTFAICYQEVTPELISNLEELEALKLSEEEEAERITRTTVVNNFKAKMQAQAEANAKRLSSSSSGKWSSSLTDLNKQNGVYVENGVFYKPKGTSGKNCPPSMKGTQYGYNNDYGYNNHFYDMLMELKKAANAEGYDFTPSTQGCRSYDSQVSTAKKYANEPGRAATPGRSNHGWGVASDLDFKNNASEKWVHEHANEYGLAFPLYGNGYKGYQEPWHIEPLYLKSY